MRATKSANCLLFRLQAIDGLAGMSSARLGPIAARPQLQASSGGDQRCQCRSLIVYSCRLCLMTVVTAASADRWLSSSVGYNTVVTVASADPLDVFICRLQHGGHSRQCRPAGCLHLQATTRWSELAVFVAFYNTIPYNPVQKNSSYARFWRGSSTDHSPPVQFFFLNGNGCCAATPPPFRPASWNDFGLALPDELRVSSFP